MAGLDFYKSQEGISGARPSDIVLPRIVDGGQALTGVSEAIMSAAKPYLVHNAEEAAARDAGLATIVKDPETGNYVRSATPKGGLIYTQALNQALDAREGALRDNDFQERIHALALEHSRDPAAFREAAAGATEAALASAPPQLRAQLEGRWTRTYGEYLRGIGQKVQSETEASLVRTVNTTLENSLKAIHSVTVANPGGDNEAIIADYRTQAINALRSLKGLGRSDAEIKALEDGFDVSLMDEHRYVETTKALADSAPLFATADTPEKLVILEEWGKGVDNKETIAGLNFKTFQERYGPQVAARIGSYAEGKRHELERQAAAKLASQPPPMTASEYRSERNFQENNPTGVPGISSEQAAALDADFLKRMGAGSTTEVMQTPQGRVAVAGMIAQTGVAPIGTVEAIQKLRSNGSASGAFQAIELIRQQRHDKYMAGETFYRNLPNDLKSLHSWVEELHQLGIGDQDIDQMDKAKALGQWRSLDKGLFAKYQTPQGKTGYGAIRDQAVMDLFGIRDPHALDNSRPIWEHEYDMLMEANLNRFDNPQQAFKATARTMKSLLSPSPYFWGGIGDSRIFHAGMSTSILDQLAAKDPRFKGVKWSDQQPNGQPAVILKNIQPTTYPNKIGTYEIRVFAPKGNAVGGQPVSAFRVDMDQLLATHDRIYAANKARMRQDHLKDARPDAWILREGKYILNPALGEWQARQTAKLGKEPWNSDAYWQKVAAAGYFRR